MNAAAAAKKTIMYLTQSHIDDSIAKQVLHKFTYLQCSNS